MKIIISGGWSYGNVGDEVILRSNMYLFDKFFSDIQKVYTSYNVENFRKLYQGYDEKVVCSVHRHLSKNKFFTHDLINYNYDHVSNNLCKYGLEEYSKLFDEDTVFVMSGGGYFTEDWNAQFISRLVELKIAQDRGAKTIIIGQSIGPIVKNDYKVAVKNLFNKCSYIAVRDRSSLNLLGNIGIVKKIEYIPDLAVIISNVVKKEYSVNGTIGIMPAAYSPYLSSKKKVPKLIKKIKKYYSHDRKRYEIEYKKLVNNLSKQYKVNIIMSTEWEEDIKFARKLINESNKKNISIITTKTPDDLCEQISKTQFFISTKMHPLIIASSYEIPMLGISYNFKVDDYMNMIGKGDCCFSNENFLANILFNKLQDTKNNKVDMEKFKKQIFVMMDDIVNVLNV